MKSLFLFDFISKIENFLYFDVCNMESVSIFFSQNLDGEMFFNTMMISVIQLIMYLLASTLINTLGNRVMLGRCSHHNFHLSLDSIEGSLL